MKVQIAKIEDVESWLNLAAEVEHLFGPMVSEPGFIASLNRNIDRGSAFCVRESDGPPGTPLLAGMLVSFRPPKYEIGWMSVSKEYRHRGLGTALLNHALNLVTPPAEIRLTTFGEDVAGGEAARKFYISLGFKPAEMTENGPEGGSRQVFRKQIR